MKKVDNRKTDRNNNSRMKLMVSVVLRISIVRPDLVIVKKKKKTCRIVDFVVLADLRVKLKESEKTLLENCKKKTYGT